MKKTLLLTLAVYLSCISFAQELTLIKFEDKPSASVYLNNPITMLSQKALDRRTKYNIALDETDVPVEANYVSQIKALNIEPIAVSKWFNGVFAELTSAQITQIEALSFVSEVESFVKNESGKKERFTQKKFNENGIDELDYGQSNAQITQLNLNYIHDLGFTGADIDVAVFDAGFPNVNTNPAFSYIRDNNQLKGGYNFVNDDDNFYTSNSHGALVLSTMAGYIEGDYVGTAIDANYYLYITEDVSQESPLEEIYWIRAAEHVDSIGVDVINSSLGYYEFDDTRYNYTYANLNGETAFISRGAQKAAQKGIMVVNSAGNSGSSPWYYIAFPADAVDVFTIGAVDSQGNPASFTSNGPSADGRIKPDVSAMGANAAFITTDGSIIYGNGTSFSSPIMAGAMACLIEAFYTEQPSVLRQKVRESAHLFDNPTAALGYGIPNFETVYNSLLGVDDVAIQQDITIYPNPTANLLKINSKSTINTIDLYNLNGKLLLREKNKTQINMAELPIGIYILNVTLANGNTFSKKIIKR